MKICITDKSALIIVDIQNDFCPGGALPVPNGEVVISVLNRYSMRFINKGQPVYYTRDWHPENHVSFILQGGVWPPHCVRDTVGARFHSDLLIQPDSKIISKGTDPHQDAYSGFQQTDLKDQLQSGHIRRVFVGGLATDYCVKSTVLDAIEYGFETVLLFDASRGVDLEAGDSDRAIDEMLRAGAIKITISDLEQEIVGK